jgi:hypothetical protein
LDGEVVRPFPRHSVCVYALIRFMCRQDHVFGHEASQVGAEADRGDVSTGFPAHSR